MGHVFYYLRLVLGEFGHARGWGWDWADSSSPRVGIGREMQQEQDKQHRALGRERQLSVCLRKQTSFIFFKCAAASLACSEPCDQRHQAAQVQQELCDSSRSIKEQPMPSGNC